jgi:hypothetical protein
MQAPITAALRSLMTAVLQTPVAATMQTLVTATAPIPALAAQVMFAGA